MDDTTRTEDGCQGEDTIESGVLGTTERWPCDRGLDAGMGIGGVGGGRMVREDVLPACPLLRVAALSSFSWGKDLERDCFTSDSMLSPS